MGKYSKGANAERELQKMLEEEGFSVIRSAGSHVIDLVAGNNDKYLCIEAKTTKKEKVYLKEKDKQKLLNFTQDFGGTPFFAVKLTRRGWWFLEPENLLETNKGYKITEKHLKKQGKDFKEFIGESKQEKLI